MGLKEAGLRGSLRNVSEVTPAFYDVQITGTNEPITEGDTLDVNYQVQNTGDQDGIKDVFLEIDTVEEDRDSNISLSGGATATGTLQWVTQDGEAGTYNAVVLSPDDSDSVSVSVGADAIPDSGNLQARYDARDLSLSDGDSVTSWPDAANNNDLSTGTAPTFRASGSGTISALPSVEFDGTDDVLTASFASSNSEPYSVWFLGVLTNRNTGNRQIAWADEPEPESGFVGYEIDNGSGNHQWKINGSSDSTLVGNDTNTHIHGTQFANGDGTLRIDGVDQTTAFADSGSNALDGISIAARQSGFYANLEVVELLVYETAESNFESDIESHLDRDTSIL